MAYTTPLATLTASLGANGGTTSAMDTTGADLLIAAVGYTSGPPTLTDSKGNTWVGLTASTVTDSFSRIYYVENPVVGTGHTITVTGSGVYAAISVQAWAGALTSSVFDQQNTNGAGASTSVQPGSVTPSSSDQLVVTSLSNGGDTSDVSRSINSGFTITGQIGTVGSTSYVIALAYLVQTAAAAVNPTWSWSSSFISNTTIATFKPSASGGGDVSAKIIFERAS